MRKVLISGMCHPDRNPKIEIPPGEGYEAFFNRTPNYAEAYRVAIARAVSGEMDLVTADTDGYHPAEEIVRLASGSFYGDEVAALVLPYRENIGLQSRTFSYMISLILGKRIRDSTTGLCRLSYGLMRPMPRLVSDDMTVHIEILKHAVRTKAEIIQYGYLSDANDDTGSKRTSNYQWKLLKSAFS